MDERALAQTMNAPSDANAAPDGSVDELDQVDLFGMLVAPASPSSISSAQNAPAPRNVASRPPADTASLWADDDDADADSEEADASTEPDDPASSRTEPPARKRRARDVLAVEPSADVTAIAATLPPNVHLGTSTWSFPGWNGIVYGDDYSNSKLSRDGLTAYGAHPLLRTVSIDRSFYAALPVTDYLRYAQQVPDHFRFIVKAPALVTDATVRAERGEPVSANPCFLNAQLATDEFVRPCLDGLGTKAGALVFQFSPLPDEMLADPAAFIERLAAFLGALPPLPAEPGGPCYAVEIRDGCLLTPRFIRTLKTAGVRYCVGVHARMPDPLRQAAALALLDADGDGPAGPLIVRWSLHGGFRYEQAKAKYEPFDRLVDEDPPTRRALAELAARYAIAGQPVLIAVNNKAEGSAPLTCIELARLIAEAIERMKNDGA
ncbi:DUF72 domain-containing protein [Paraburkholderia sp.]|uniref:DUF72 domain-containing protein n=1 Tax=Paraburkholderia sp. TaxID=1926495 RepID=UPI003D6F1502